MGVVMKNVVLIPAYEPTKKMLDLLIELKRNNLEIVIVNDGSSRVFDEIFNKSRKYGVVLEHDVNRGKGVAIKTGLKYIDKEYKNYNVITVDCDGQHSVSDTLNLLNILSNYPNDLILGKRLRNIKIPLNKKISIKK